MGRLRIISQSGEPFIDRAEAGGLLADELKKYRGGGTVVLGIPRGGIVIARRIADKIGASLDIVLSRKLGAPGNPELAIGAVSEDGKLFLRYDMISDEEARESRYMQDEKARQVSEIKRRIALYRKIHPKISLKGRMVIVTDDGLATGATMQAALWSAKQEAPKKLVAAVPVAPRDTAERLSRDADEMIVLRVPDTFAAVGQFYARFDQVEDEEVLKILKEDHERTNA